MKTLSDYEMGWLVGILEGEGHFGILRSSVGQTQRVAVKMCDEDVVNRVAVFFERLTGNTFDVRLKIDKQHPDWSDQYEIYAGGENARTIMKAVVKYMGVRRRRKIYQSLNGHVQKKVKVNIDISKLISPKISDNVTPLKRRSM